MMRRALAVLVVAALGVLGACGGDSKEGSSSTPTTLTASGFNGKGSVELCKLAQDYATKIRAVVAAFGDPAQARSLLAELEPAVRRGIAVAPAEIKGDVEYLADTFKQVLDALQSGTQPNLASVTDPQFQKSLNRVVSYGGEVCGVTTSPS